MKCSIVNTCCKAVFIAVCICSFHSVQAQVSQERLTELRSKYDWGSIYLAYGNIPDVITLLDNPKQLERIKAKYNYSPPPGLVSFFTRSKEPSQRKSVVLFQINFSASTPVAGYLTSRDFNGTINRIPMNPGEVLRVADWVDLYLTHAWEWAQLASGMYVGKIGLKDAWQSIGNLSLEPFVSESRISSLLIVFMQYQAQNETQLEAMKTTDPKLYDTLKLFTTYYHATTTALIKEFYQPEQVYKVPQPQKKGGMAQVPDLPDPDGSTGAMQANPRAPSSYDRQKYEDLLKARIYEAYQKALQRKSQ